jgi:DHA1 family bicyclomycin/chloramphenicol resistance-like MFS transporter
MPAKSVLQVDCPAPNNPPSPSLILFLGSLTAFSPLAIDMYLPTFPQIERDLSAPTGIGEKNLAELIIP